MSWNEINVPSESTTDILKPSKFEELKVKVINPLIKITERYKTPYLDVQYDGRDMKLSLSNTVLQNKVEYALKQGMIKSNTVLWIINLGKVEGKKYIDYRISVSDSFAPDTPKAVTSNEELYVCTVCNNAYLTIKELQIHQSEMQHKGMRVKQV